MRSAKPFFEPHEAILKQNPSSFAKVNAHKERKMRTLIFGAVLIAVASVGFHVLISGSLAAAREAKAATFSERFAPVLKSAPGT